ncbi:MAG: alkaline phosphatase D family protein [Pseudomonadales bacterium]|jgi:alkaline phosphatase D|nr:alkaline phosphatase D family protein [Pseudomonadales bacterium]
MPSRRRFLMTSAGVMLATPLAGALGSMAGRTPFALGVASGAPRPDRVTLWTRIAPDPLAGGGAPDEDLEVRCLVARDPAFGEIVLDRRVPAPRADAHSVHFTVEGLAPGSDYFYRFELGEDASPVGRTRTAPAADADSPLRLAVASCQHYEAGFFAAWRDVAEAAPDLVVHLGDYIYEYGPRPLGRTPHPRIPGVELEVLRQHASPEVRSLFEYRNRYAQYRLDPDLQAAHAAAPWLVSFDDHEVDNNWAGTVPEDPERQTPLEFRVRRRAALQAWWEHMPLDRRPRFDEVDASVEAHGRWRFGRQLELLLLDTRQYRSDQPCGQGFPADLHCEDRRDPRLSMLGGAQRRWLDRALGRGDARWTVLAQQTWFSPFAYPGDRWNMDQWDGYTAEREALIRALAAPRVSNPVVLGGDWHYGAAFDVPSDPANPESAPAAAEFDVASISTPCLWASAVDAAAPGNPHMRYSGGDRRGWLDCRVDAEGFAGEFRVVADPTDAASAIVGDRTLRVAAGRRGLEAG